MPPPGGSGYDPGHTPDAQATAPALDWPRAGRLWGEGPRRDVQTSDRVVHGAIAMTLLGLVAYLEARPSSALSPFLPGVFEMLGPAGLFLALGLLGLGVLLDRRHR